MTCEIRAGDAAGFLRALAPGSVDLVCGSPPYCDARTYGRRDVSRGAVAWVDWMLDVTTAAVQACRGAVVWVVSGVQRDGCYWPACEGLAWEWFKAGGSLWRPVIWTKNGLMGSGGRQNFRNDWEYCLVMKRPGSLPWADNKACGHPPKYVKGGESSHRERDGRRVNKWGGGGADAKGRRKGGEQTPVSPGAFDSTRPAICNPGNVLHVNVGGGRLGHPLAHDNEAPYPEGVPERFVKSWCPPGGLVADPFVGSGTTAAVALKNGRRFVGCDLRPSQVVLAYRRLYSECLSFDPIDPPADNSASGERLCSNASPAQQAGNGCEVLTSGV